MEYLIKLVFYRIMQREPRSLDTKKVFFLVTSTRGSIPFQLKKIQYLHGRGIFV